MESSHGSHHVKGVLLIIFVGLASFARADAIDDYVKAEMKRLQIPAVAFAIVKSGAATRSEAFGFSDVAAKKEAKVDDLFAIGSLTKQFTAEGFLMLVEFGKVDIEDPITKYLADAPPEWKTVKVRNLLFQNSGLPDYEFVSGLGQFAKFTRPDFMAAMGKVPLDFEPGQAWAYSNTNYALLGWIIEDVTKEPYTKFIEENVLRLSGMMHSRFSESAVDVPGLARGYILRRRGPVATPGQAASIKSDGALISNIPDLLKWDEVLTDMRLLKRKSYASMWSRGKLNSGRTHAYGMGWYVNVSGPNASMAHGGASAGYSAGIVRYPRLKLSVIVLTNVDPLDGEAIARQIAEMCEPSLKASPFAAITDPDPKRTDQIKTAIGALAANNPDESLLEPEIYGTMKSARSRAAGPGTWRFLKTIDQMTFGGEKAQGDDTFLTYRITSGEHSFIASILWSSKNKIVDATLSPENPAAPVTPNADRLENRFKGLDQALDFFQRVVVNEADSNDPAF